MRLTPVSITSSFHNTVGVRNMLTMTAARKPTAQHPFTAPAQFARDQVPEVILHHARDASPTLRAATCEVRTPFTDNSAAGVQQLLFYNNNCYSATGY